MPADESTSGRTVIRSLHLLLVPLLALVVSCARTPPRPLNVLLVVVDSLRQDELGVFGSPVSTSPNLDALASEGVSFVNGYTVTPWTLPSVASILTGLPPGRHGAIEPRLTLSPDAVTVAEILRGAGYRTAAAISHIFLKKRYGMDQGFEEFHDTEGRGHEYVSTPGVTRQARYLLRKLAPGPEPFFLFLHYFDPHYDYVRHPEFGLANVPSGRLEGGETIRELLDLAPDMTPEEIGFIRRVYGEETRLTDSGIGQVLRELEEAGLDDHTLVIVVADHGEEFRSRGDWIGHTIHLYDEDMRIPLIIRDPRAKSAGRLVEEPVSVVGLVSTILDLAGVPAPPGPRGESFADAVRRAAPLGARDIFCEVDFEPLFPDNVEKVSHKRAFVREGFKLIRDESDRSLELYDLTADPGERRNLASARPDLTEALERALDAASREAAAGRFEGDEVELTEKQIERLRSLGYAGDQ